MAKKKTTALAKTDNNELPVLPGIGDVDPGRRVALDVEVRVRDPREQIEERVVDLDDVQVIEDLCCGAGRDARAQTENQGSFQRGCGQCRNDAGPIY